MLAGAALVFFSSAAGCPVAPWDSMLSLAPRNATMAVWADLREARSSLIVRRLETDPRWITFAGCELSAEQLLLALDEQGPVAWVVRGGEASNLASCGQLEAVRADAETVVLVPPRAQKAVRKLAKRPRRSKTRLGRLLCGAPRPTSMAFAARLGPTARKRLRAMPNWGPADTLSSIVGGIELRERVRVSLRARLGSKDAASQMAQAITTELDGWKRQPLLALAGMGALADGVKTNAKGRTTTLEADLAEADVLRVVNQLDILSRISRKQ